MVATHHRPCDLLFQRAVSRERSAARINNAKNARHFPFGNGMHDGRDILMG